jgi:hypothetical protein
MERRGEWEVKKREGTVKVKQERESWCWTRDWNRIYGDPRLDRGAAETTRTRILNTHYRQRTTRRQGPGSSIRATDNGRPGDKKDYGLKDLSTLALCRMTRPCHIRLAHCDRALDPNTTTMAEATSPSGTLTSTVSTTPGRSTAAYFSGPLSLRSTVQCLSRQLPYQLGLSIAKTKLV